METLFGALFFLALLGLAGWIAHYFYALRDKELRKYLSEKLRDIEEDNAKRTRDELIKRVRAPSGDSGDN